MRGRRGPAGAGGGDCLRVGVVSATRRNETKKIWWLWEGKED